MKLILIRHGETITSGRTYAGRNDVPLNAHGKDQAQILARQLADLPLSAILSSPLSRAMDTAWPLALAHGLVPLPLPELMELDFGDYEGQTKEALGLTLRKTHAHTALPGGESLLDVWNRAGRVLDHLRSLPYESGTCCAVVGHFWINRLLWGRAHGLSFDEASRARDYRPKTGSVVQISMAHRAPSIPLQTS